MPQRLSTSDPGFERAFAAFLAAKRETSQDVDDAASAIIADVRARGDAALAELTLRFDRLDLAKTAMRVSDAEIAAAVAACDRETVAALELAHARIDSHHRRQLPHDDRYTDKLGAELGSRWTAVELVGLYVPGGLASYPSSVLMNAVPARVAGVPRIVMAVPASGGEMDPLVLAAAHLAGVHEIYRIGGAQAVAALAYGTQTIRPVVKIVGPGNAYVAAAKRQVFGVVGIDSIAGPSEVLVIADADNDPEWIAADLLAQAEHDTAAQAILMTDSAALAERVVAAVERQLAALPRGNIAGASWATFGAVIVVRSLDEAPALADRIAAEHVEIATRDPDALAGKIRNAGAIFLGAHTPEVIGDYVAGSNHVLPTARSARFSSGLGVLDFMKRTSILKLDAGALAELAPAAMTLARAEGLEAHRRSVAVRLAKPDGQQGLSAMFEPPVDPNSKSRLTAIRLDDASIKPGNSNIEHEREVAIFDIIESNRFELEGRDDGPYTLVLSIVEDRLVFTVAQQANAADTFTCVLSFTPLRRVLKDYFMVCETYYQAIRTAPPSRIQSIDMGRRALHDEGSKVLIERLKGKISVDNDTARRLFTLICALHWKG